MKTTKPPTVSWNELERCFNLCSMFCPKQPSCDKAVTLQTNREHEVVSVCGEKPLKGQDDTGRTGRRLRLVLFEECRRNCSGCCNKDFDLPSLPVCDSYKGYELIMLTGGEPMLHPEKVMEAVGRIRRETDAPIILYTALTADKDALSRIIRQINGITVTLHDNSDVKPFLDFDDYYVGAWGSSKTYRLNVFNGVEIDLGDVKGKWKVKPEIEWIKDCPLPEGEVLMRFESSKEVRGKCRR